jgi:hypothetical protein
MVDPPFGPAGPATDADSRPVPDPTQLTTEALHREVGQLRELFKTLLGGEGQVTLEKFESVKTQLALIENQRVEQKKDTKDAVDAALAAAKEAVKEQTTASERAIAKSEAATTKSIDQLGEKFDTAVDGLRREIGDLKERVAGAEQQKVGRTETSGSFYQALGLIALAAGLLIALATYAATH